jgi:hypothetical protein
MTVTKLWRIWALSLVAVSLSWLILREFAPGEDQAKAAVRHSTRPPAVSPAPRPVDPSAALASLSSTTLWGPIAQRTAPGQPAAGASEPSTPKWSLSGYYDDSGTRYVIVSFEQLARPSQQLKLHDKLPDGARIEAIEPDRASAADQFARGNAC